MAGYFPYSFIIAGIKESIIRYAYSPEWDLCAAEATQDAPQTSLAGEIYY